MIKWGTNLVLDIARRQCVLYLGSGVSHNSVNAVGERPMTWKELLSKGTEHKDLSVKQKKLIKEKIKIGDYLLACELLRRFLGRETFNDFLDDSFRTPKFSEAEIHKELFSLDSRIVITPNIDNIYETFA